MQKILTISVAAYNMEKYIRENIDSMLASPLSEELEIFVVDDGGKDSTLEIAKEYEEKHPSIIHAVHKDNGGYGSVQNYSLKYATGRYFKILDGDDWMDTEEFTKLIEYLKRTNVDAVVSAYSVGTDKDNIKKCYIKKQKDNREILNPNELKLDYSIGMWSLTYKTEVLRLSGLLLPEHTLYTDRLYATIPFSYVKKMAILDFPVYCHRISRDGQSVSIESRIKHIDEYLLVTKKICEHYRDDARKHKEYILLKAYTAYKVTIRALLLLPASKENMEKLRMYEKEIKAISPDIYKQSASLKSKMGWVIRFLRITRYKGYWILGLLPKEVIKY